MGVTARNVGNLERFQRQLKTVPQALPKLAERVGVALVKQVMDEFRESKDPYGRGWLPVYRNRLRERRARARALKQGNWQRALRRDKPLLDTGRLRGSTDYAVVGSQVRVFLSANYASYHDQPDGGKHRIARRQILPSKGNLGPTWTAAVEKEAKRTVAEHFKGG